MRAKRILIMHISSISGHRSASLAIEKALHAANGEVQTYNIDAFAYFNPALEKLIDQLYRFIIQRIPIFWDYLYDNRKIYRLARRIRTLIHRLADQQIKKLLTDFQPDIVVCTQAFPCGMVADYKSRYHQDLPLVGVLTDYAPHIYWLSSLVDMYIVPDHKIKERLIQRGVPSQRLQVLGIPIDAKFAKQSNADETRCFLGLDPQLPVILIMGGGQGFGPIEKAALALNGLAQSCQLIVVCGTNKKLYKWLTKNKSRFTKPIAILGYTEQIDKLMAVSSFVVTKPGGITTAEAISKSLPIIIIRPLPGQESLNAQFLLEAKVALKANSLQELKAHAEQLLTGLSRLNELRRQAMRLARTNSASEIAGLILNMAERSNVSSV